LPSPAPAGECPTSALRKKLENSLKGKINQLGQISPQKKLETT
jgi:hypothetical protein